MSSKTSKGKSSLEKQKQFNDTLEELLKNRQNEISKPNISDEAQDIPVPVQVKIEEVKRLHSDFFHHLYHKMQEEDREHEHLMQMKKLEAELEACMTELERKKATDSATRRQIQEMNAEIERLRTELNSRNEDSTIYLQTIIATIPVFIHGAAELIRVARM